MNTEYPKKIAENVKNNIIDGISDLRDESDRNGVRVVIELKKDVEKAINKVKKVNKVHKVNKVFA